jgi:hypothetical protein
MILPVLMETTSKTKLQGLWHNGIHPFWFSFGCYIKGFLMVILSVDIGGC